MERGFGGRRPGGRARACRTCGQHHMHHEPHVYDYAQEVDEDLTCHICLTPFVTPLDTPCGHTFCHACLTNYLKVQQLCPIDRKPLSEQLCSPSSIVLRKLLEKLNVNCPNTDSCEEVLPRGNLEDHLKYRCPGTQVACKYASAGCDYRGPPRTVHKHQAECGFSSQGITRLPILEGEMSHIEIPRTSPTLGITIVGGADTPLRCVVVQEVFPDGLIAQDGRLQPGDQLIEINGIDMTCATHHQICQALRKMCSVLRLGVYRERIEAYGARPSSHYTEELHNVTLEKQPGQQLGIRLSGRCVDPGIYILEILEGSTTAQDGRLQPYDRILFINGEDVRNCRLEQASQLIQNNEKVSLVVARKKYSPKPTFPLEQLEDEEEREEMNGEGLTISHIRARSAPEPLPSDQTHTLSQETNGTCVPQVWTNGKVMTPTHPNIESNDNGEVIALTPTTTVDNSNSSSNLVFHERSYSCEALETSTNNYAKDHHFARHTHMDSPSRRSSYEYSDDMVAMMRKAMRIEGIQTQQKSVIIHKGPNESLGMRIGGGLGSSEGDTPIYIANIHPQGCIGKSRQIRKGDILLSVNGTSLVGLTHSQAVATLKATVENASVILGVMDGPETSFGSSNFIPSWLYWQKLPRCLQFPKTVILNRSPGASWGFSIVGGTDPMRGTEPIHVLFVVQDSPAAKDGKLKCGDRLLAVDRKSLESVKHSIAVTMLKQTGTRVVLEAVSWMGTEL